MYAERVRFMSTCISLKSGFKSFLRGTVRFVPVALVLLSVIFMHVSTHASTQSSICQSFNVPVALNVGQPLQYTIYGELCDPASGASHTVQLTIPGATYDHRYWDFAYQPQTYSYVRAMNAAGYSTFNIDRIGTGLSSHPDLSLVNVTLQTNAYVVHEIVQALRSGLIGNRSFARVMLVGHSLGSAVVWLEAGTYHDVDGVIITGLLHLPNAIGLAHLFATLYPAALDARFASADYGVGYLTTEPGTRGQDFYYAPGVDPNVVATDEATKETATDGEIASFAPLLVDGISAQIKVPVLLVVGQLDGTMCGLLATNCSSAATLLQAEAPYYAPQAQLQTAVIANSGHDLALHTSAPLYFSATLAWALKYLAP
jgi:pimeloyl-ACP methyl ester carboxylesterase